MLSPTSQVRLEALDAPVRNFMRPGVVTVSDDTSLRQVQRAMVSHGVHAVLLTAAQHGRLVGWITARALLARLHDDLSLIPASMASLEPVIVIDPSATGAEALEAMSAPGVTHLLVGRSPDGPAQGVVSELDLIRLGGS